MQIFTPRRIVAVTNGSPWTPEAGDRVFAVTEYIGYKINGGTEANLESGSIRGVVKGYTYTFNADSVIEVM